MVTWLFCFRQSPCYQKAEPETYLIPSFYTGKVNILFNQNSIPVKYTNEYNKDTIYTSQIGAPIKYENVRRIYEKPYTGILLTQYKESDGFIDRQYYSVESEGKRTPLSIFEFKHFKKDSAEYIINDVHQKGIFGDCTSGTLGNMHIFFQDFTVCSYNQFDSFFTKEYQKQFDYKLEQATTLTLQLE